MTTTRLIYTWTMVMLLSSVRLHAAAAAGEVLVYDGVANSAVATNALRVTGTTNVAVKGNLTAHSGTFTNLTASLPVEADSSKKIVSGTQTGTGAFVKDTSPTIVTPTIASFANANHDHSNSAGGGQIGTSGISDNAVTGAKIALTSQAAGDVMYYNGTDWVRLAKGTAGQVLEMNAGATAPEWDTDDSGSGGGTVGTVINTGTPVQYALPYYSDTTGTNIAPSKITTDASGTNLFAGVVTATNSVVAGTGNGTLQLGQTSNQKFTISGNGDGTVTFTGDGAANDEDFKIDPVGTANTAVFTSSTGMATWDFGTSWVFKLGSIEIGHASDSTLTRNAAGFLSAEGKPIASPASAVAGDVMYFDGTQWVRLAKGTAGQVLEMNAGATAPEWDTDDNSGAATAFNDIADSSGNGSVTIGHTNIWDFTLDGSRFLYFLASDADNAADTTLLTLAFNDAADANSIALDVVSDADGTPSSVFKLSATALTTSVAITPTGAIDAGGAASLEIPNGNDPDLAVEGQLSYDANGDVLRAYDGTAQVAIGRKIEAIHCTVILPNDLADSARDAFWMWSNESGMSFIVTGWKAWSDTDDTDLNIEEIASDGTGNTTVDAVTIATNGTGLFTGSDTTITAATIENGNLLVLDFDDTDTPGQVKITIYGYYAADVN